MLYVNSLELI